MKDLQNDLQQQRCVKMMLQQQRLRKVLISRPSKKTMVENGEVPKILTLELLMDGEPCKQDAPLIPLVPSIVWKVPMEDAQDVLEGLPLRWLSRDVASVMECWNVASTVRHLEL